MSKRALIRSALVVLAVLLPLLFVLLPHSVDLRSADHREAPLINEDPVADLADTFAFVNPSDPTKVVFAATVNGFAVPAVRGTYSFGTEVLYQIKIDNTGDGTEDLVIQAIFDGYEAVRDPRCPANPNGQGGQFVTVLGPAKPKRTGATNHLLRGRDVPVISGCTNLSLSAGGIRAFAGLRDDHFVADVGQLNRILGGLQDVFRMTVSPALGPLRGRPVRADGTSGVDAFGGFNVSTLVVEVPRALVQGSRNRSGTYLQNNATIGIWSTTSRPGHHEDEDDGGDRKRGPFVQIQRNGHQVVKTVFIPAGVRDFFNATVPANDLKNFGNFLPDALTTADNDGTGNTIAGRAALLTAAGVVGLPNGAPLLLPAGFGNTDKDLIRKVVLPDILRLNLDAPASSVGVASNGYQNGRRPDDDVVDIVLLLARQLADVKFPSGTGFPGSGPLGNRRALDCSSLATCDRRVFAVLQGTDFIKPDAQIAALNLATSGNDRVPTPTDFPFFTAPHPLPGQPGTVGFPPQQ